MKHTLFKNHSQKRDVIDPIIGGALIGAGTNILGGIFGSKGQDSANKTNLQIARETNEQNYKIFQEQNAFNRAERLETQDFNSPAAQRKRLLMAGINPLAANIGNQPSNPQQSGSTQMQTGAPMQNVYGSLAQGVQNAGTIFADSMLKKAQADNINADTKQKEANLPKTQEETRALKIANDVREWTQSFEKQANQSRFWKEYQENTYMAELAQLYFETINGDGDEQLGLEARNTIKSAFLSSFKEQNQRAMNAISEGKKLEAEEKETLARAKNYADALALGYAGIKANVGIATAKNAVDKYLGELQYKLGMEGLSKSTEGFIIDILKQSGLSPKEIGELIRQFIGDTSKLHIIDSGGGAGGGGW